MYNKLFVGIDVSKDAFTENKLLGSERELLVKLKNNLEKGFKNRTLSSKKLTEYNLYDKLLKSDDLCSEVVVLNRLECRLLNRNAELSALVYRLRFLCVRESYADEYNLEEYAKEKSGRGSTVPFVLIHK